MRTLGILAVLFGSGCASHSTLWVYSQPPGAYITELETDRVVGIAPAVSSYLGSQLKQFRNAEGCFLVKGYEARWVSDARTTSEHPLRLCSGATDTYTITLSRDSAHPDLEKDLQFALQVQTILVQQQQARAAQDAATAALIGAFTAAQQAATPVRCTSYPVGDNTVQTTCK